MNSNRRPSSEALWLLGSNLKRLREARGYSQIELGRRSGLDNNQISKIELEQGNASLALLDALAKGLDCSLQDLFIPIREPSHDVQCETETEYGHPLAHWDERAKIA